MLSCKQKDGNAVTFLSGSSTSLSLWRLLPVCSSLVQMLLDDLLALPKWLQLLKMEYFFFHPLSACPFSLPGFGEMGKVSDSRLSLTCRHKFIISLQKVLWLCVQPVPSPSFSASFRKSCCSLRTSETKRRRCHVM